MNKALRDAAARWHGDFDLLLLRGAVVAAFDDKLIARRLAWFFRRSAAARRHCVIPRPIYRRIAVISSSTLLIKSCIWLWL
jgi:hypothetical protein